MTKDPFAELGFQAQESHSQGGDPFASLGFQATAQHVPPSEMSMADTKARDFYGENSLMYKYGTLPARMFNQAAEAVASPYDPNNTGLVNIPKAISHIPLEVTRSVKNIASLPGELYKTITDPTVQQNKLASAGGFVEGAYNAVGKPVVQGLTTIGNTVMGGYQAGLKNLTGVDVGNKDTEQAFNNKAQNAYGVAQNFQRGFVENPLATSAMVAETLRSARGLPRGTDAISSMAKPAIGVAQKVASPIVGMTEDLLQQYKQYKTTKIQNMVNADVDQLLKQTKGISNQVQMGFKKNTNIKTQLSDPQIFSGLKVESGKINPDQAITTIDGRLDRVMDAKSEMLPFADKYAPEQTRDALKIEAYKNIEGKYTPKIEKTMQAAIDVEVDALPEKMNVSTLDNFRARFRNSARNAQGLPLENEYTALENASRDMVFKATDNLPVDTGGEFAKANTYVKDLLNTRQFLDKTLRNQIVKGGRLTNVTARVVGATAGSQFGFLGSLVGQEIASQIADIMVNNQLGNNIKFNMIQNLTDNPEVLSQVQSVLNNMKTYKPLMLESGVGKPKTTTYGSSIIPVITGKEGEYVGKINPVINQRLPVVESNQIPNSTAPSITNIIPRTLPQTTQKVNVLDSTVQKFKETPRKQGGFMALPDIKTTPASVAKKLDNTDFLDLQAYLKNPKDINAYMKVQDIVDGAKLNNADQKTVDRFLQDVFDEARGSASRKVLLPKPKDRLSK